MTDFLTSNYYKKKSEDSLAIVYSHGRHHLTGRTNYIFTISVLIIINCRRYNEIYFTHYAWFRFMEGLAPQPTG
jgi:hypothetical protein